MHTPDLVRIQEEYGDRGVRFLALTDEPPADLEKIHQFAQQLQVPWPIGYGAGETIAALRVPGYPTTFVVGRDGHIVWHSFQTGTLDGAIRKAL